MRISDWSSDVCSSDLFIQLVETYRLPPPAVQASISGPSGWIGTVDFLFEQVRHVVEIDSSWHDGPMDRAADAERDEALRAAGYTVERYRYGRLVGEPAAVAREDRKSNRLKSRHSCATRLPASACKKKKNQHT